MPAYTVSRFAWWLTTSYPTIVVPMQAQTTQAHLWNLLPPDVTKDVLHRLPFRHAWKCRSLSSCWASAVRASVPVEVVIPAKRQTLRAKLQRLQKSTWSTSPSQRIYTFKLDNLVSVTECSRLLRSLTKQVRPMLSVLVVLSACIEPVI